MAYRQMVFTYYTRQDGEVVGKEALDQALKEANTFVQDIIQSSFDGGQVSGGVVTTVLVIAAPGYENSYSIIHKKV